MNSNVFNDANYKKLYKASKVVVIPGFVKAAPAEEEQIFDKTASTIFADPVHRRYPLDTKSNTWLSRMYFELMDKEAYDKKIAANISRSIEEAVEFWKLEPMEMIPVQEKEAYLIPLTVDNQPVHTVSISSKDHYKQAVEDLVNSFDKLAYRNRREYARGLYFAPEEFKTDIPEEASEYIEKAAGFGMSTRKHVGKTILDRVTLLRSRPAYSSKLTEIGKNLPETMTPVFLDKVAEVVDNIDRDCGFVKYYGHGLMSPEEALFYVTEKTASLVKDEMIPLANGNVIHKTAILKDNKGVIDNFFMSYYGEKPYGDDVQEKIAVIQSLPAPEADALQNLTGLK